MAGEPALGCDALLPALAVAGAPAAVMVGAAVPAAVVATTGIAPVPAVLAAGALAPAIVAVVVIAAGAVAVVFAALDMPAGTAGMLGAFPPATTPDGTDAATPGVPQAPVVTDRIANPEATTRPVSVVVLLSLTLASQSPNSNARAKLQHSS
jgi:hypothetical protein